MKKQIVVTNFLVYTLGFLIQDKYGKDRYAFGCQITAQWVTAETKTICTAEEISYWCNLHKDVAAHKPELLMPLDVLNALLPLFGVSAPDLMPSLN